MLGQHPCLSPPSLQLLLWDLLYQEESFTGFLATAPALLASSSSPTSPAPPFVTPALASQPSELLPYHSKTLPSLLGLWTIGYPLTDDLKHSGKSLAPSKSFPLSSGLRTSGRHSPNELSQPSELLPVSAKPTIKNSLNPFHILLLFLLSLCLLSTLLLARAGQRMPNLFAGRLGHHLLGPLPMLTLAWAHTWIAILTLFLYLILWH